MSFCYEQGLEREFARGAARRFRKKSEGRAATACLILCEVLLSLGIWLGGCSSRVGSGPLGCFGSQ